MMLGTIFCPLSFCPNAYLTKNGVTKNEQPEELNSTDFAECGE